MLMSLPMLQSLREGLGKARIEVLLRGPLQAEVFEHQDLGLEFSYLCELSDSARRAATALRRWRRERIDWLISGFNVHPLKSLLLGWMVGPRRTVGFAADGRRLPFTHCLKPLGMHKVQENLRLLDVLGLEATSCSPRWQVTAEERRQARLLLRQSLGGRDILAVTPGCTPSEASKRWPADRYAAVAEGLARKFELGVVVLGGPGEEDLAGPLLSVAGRGVAVLDAVGRLSLRQIAACLQQSRLVLGGDCGLTHIAASLGVPVLTLMGPTEPKITAPRGEKVRVLRSRHDCLGCYQKGLRIDPACGQPRCMQSITVEEVTDAAERLWRP